MSHKSKRKKTVPSRRFRLLVAFALLLIMLSLAVAAYIALDTTAQIHAAATDSARASDAATQAYQICIATHVYSQRDMEIYAAVETALAQSGIVPKEFDATFMLDQCTPSWTRVTPTSLYIRFGVSQTAFNDASLLGTDLVTLLEILENAGDNVQDIEHLSVYFENPENTDRLSWQMRYSDALASYPSLDDPTVLLEAGLR